MTALTEVFVTVKPDMDKFGPEVSKKLARIDSAKSGKQFATRFGVGLNGAIGSIVSRSAGIFAAGFAAVKVGGFLKGAITEASDLGETMSKSAAVFGPANRDILAFAKNADKSLGQTQQQAIAAASQFGNMFNQLGIGQKPAAQMSKQMVTLASDFASFHNADISTVLEAQSAAFRGEYDSIQQFVPTLNAAAVEQEGLRLKLAGSTKELTDQDKAIAVQSLLMKGAGKASGDFARTSGGLANQQRILSAQFGNFKASLGQVALPLVTKFVSFLNDKGVPVFRQIKYGVEGFAAALSGEGVTSSGFVGFMERIGAAARTSFGFFKTDVLPRLKDFGGFITGTAIPAIGNLIGAVRPLAQDVGGAVAGGFQKLLPILQSMGRFIADTIVPAVVDFTKWLKDNSTVVGAAAVGIGAMVVAFKAYQLALAIGAAATKAYAVVQAALNTVMSLNPIGVVVLALVGLAAGLTYAYKKSETFRDIVNGVWNAIKTVAQTVFGAIVGFVKGAIDWVQANFPKVKDYLMLPFTGAKAVIDTVWAGIKSVGETVYGWFITGWSLVEAALMAPFNLAKTAIDVAWTAIKTAAQSALAWVVRKFLDFAQNIIDAAANAFGWVPGLGEKLEGAAAAFKTFKDNVNRQLGGIEDQQIDFTIKYSNTGVNLTTPSSVGRRATGGPIHGPGTGTSDTAGLYALSNGEHVWTAKEVAAVGGHGVMENMRKSVASGAGFAKGGAVGVNPRLVADASGLAKSVRAAVVAAASAAAKQLAKSGGGLAGTMAFGRSQAGKPYVWGGVGPGGYDCSGFVSALINYARGRNPYRRIGATGSMPWNEFGSGTGPFMVGWFKGNPGHTAATINGVNFESRGGRGVVTGSAARGAYDGLFTNRAKVKGFAKGGAVEGDLPFDLLSPRGKAFEGKTVLKELGIGAYANGSFRIMRDQLALIHKGEMVLPKQAANPLRSILTSKLHQLHKSHVAHQAHVAHMNHVNTTRLHPDDMRHLGRIVADELRTNPPRVHLDGRQVSTAMSRMALGGGY